MTREEFETKFAVLCLGGDFKKHKELKALVHAFIEQLEKQIPKWRSVERDGLPGDEGDEGDCLIYSPRWESSEGYCFDDAEVAVWCESRRRWEGPNGVYWEPTIQVTHWLPLLDLPEPREEQP